jgi:hypothetical protein
MTYYMMRAGDLCKIQLHLNGISDHIHCYNDRKTIWLYQHSLHFAMFIREFSSRTYIVLIDDGLYVVLKIYVHEI